MNLLLTKIDAEMTEQERRERAERRAATHKQVLNDQRSNAKRDKAALRREAAWYRKNGK